MKKLLYTFMIALAAFAIAGCKETKEETPDVPKVVPEMSVLTTSFSSIPDVGGTLSVAITSNADWSVSIPAEADWLSANPINGEAGENITITLTATANEGYDKRTANVTVSCKNENGEDSAEFTVTQKQKGALILTEDVIEVSYEGGKVSVKLSANSDVTYAIADNAKEWIVVAQPNGAPTKALVESTYEFNVLPNPVKQEREGVITFTNEAGSETVTIKQEALPEPDPEISLDAISVSNVPVAGDVIKVGLTSNMPWVAALEDGVNWLSVSPASGQAGENVEITLTIQENPNNDGRFTNVSFTCTNAENESKTVKLGVSQDGLNIPSDIHISTAAQLIEFATNYNSGTYAPVIDKLTATLDADIAFDAESSAAFPGIGSYANAFKASFDGANHTISGFVGTAPMFPFIASGATVKNIVLDNTCSFTATHPNTETFQFGPVVGYLDGTLNNVKVAADVTLAAVAGVLHRTVVGGIAGIVYAGEMENCEYSGLITAPEGFTVLTPADDETERKVIIGGLAGLVEGSGKIDQSAFKGAIKNSALVEAEDVSNRYLKETPYLIIGGVAGYLSGSGSITSTSATADHAAIQSAHTGETSVGQIVNMTTIAFHSVVGGIVGENKSGTISQCTNAATIFNTIFKTGADISRYMKSGGIVGKNDAEGVVTGCTNNGTVQHRSNPKLQDLGGIAGYNAGTISACTNNAAVNHMTSGVGTKSGRVIALGGVIGENVAGAKVSDIHNTANIEISSVEDGTASDVRLGGVIGLNQAEIDGGASKNITNTGRVYFSPNLTSQILGYEIGGIAGQSEASVKNAKNSGYVYFRWNSDTNVASLVYLGGIVGKMAGNGTISGCVNEGGENNAGEVYLYVKKGTAKHTAIYAGGILGYSTSNVAIEDCNNSGYVHGGNATKVNGTTCFVGGMAAYLAGASSVSGCTNTGKLLNDHFSNTITAVGSTFEGGMVGFAKGTADSRITISNSTNTVTGIGGRRGYNGGIVGYAEYTDITGSTCNGNYIGGSGYFFGGIAGWLVNSSVSSSTYNGEQIGSSQIQGAGGIVAVLDAGSVIDGCQSKLATITHADGIACVDGAIAGKSVAGSTIKNCHYKAGLSFGICSDTNYTDGDGNVADL